ncbi:MAG: hypothetical protein K0S41_4259 [Anaerocolumna sp.]|jgi:hypothetical protein|nr:hypothetical protein [Anaerocolumna sp.]
MVSVERFGNNMLHLNKIRGGILLVIVLLSAFNLNSSQATYVLANQQKKTTISQEIINYHFLENKESFQISLDYVGDKNFINLEKYNLDAYIFPSNKELVISGIEPVELKDFLEKDFNFNIEYSIIKEDQTNCQLTWNKDELINTVDNISFTLSEDEPYWRISNSNGVWGVGIPNIGVPELIYDILPKKINDVSIEQSAEISNALFLNGKITLIAPEKNNFIIPEIKLKDFKLPKEINKQIIEKQSISSNLEIMANYNFRIPIHKENLIITGKATFLIHINIINDIK